MKYHTPVLLQEIVSFLNPKPGDFIIDATAGGGGHTFELLKRGAKVLAIDRDPEAIEYLKNQCQLSISQSETSLVNCQIGQNLFLVQGNFANVGQIANDHRFNDVSGILFDLGISSHQIEKAERGFSYASEGPLDMRMDPGLSVKAYDIVNNFDKRRLYEIFKTYGQEKFSRTISEAICRAREVKPITTTKELAQIIDEATGDTKGKYIRPSQWGLKFASHGIGIKTRIFQALRIVVNSELLNLEEGLPQTVDLLKKGGRLVIVSFHSLEDGLVKRFFKKERRLKVLTKKPVGPTFWEIENNPRSRSAKLRAAEKL
ncbi:16S rRNA (cytosine(1402)-N(4))-methyltransferase RsmH [Candidatus Curtissbacteria bacterium]|nr:16S rRNA (cytosine(1402)-N(4))-methyltransferase RsmH [Candidatus Curtissbacteria bacterium]